MFASPAKNSAQCTDVQSKLQSILGTKRLQNKLVTDLMIDRFVKLESCNKFVLKSFCSQYCVVWNYACVRDSTAVWYAVKSSVTLHGISTGL